MRDRLRALVLDGVALVATAAPLPPRPAAAATHPPGGGLTATIRYTEYGIAHIVAKDYPCLGFGKGWAQAADQACTLADGFVAGIPPDAPLGRHQFVVRNGKRIPVSGGTEGLGIWNKTEGRWDPAAGGYDEVITGSSYIQAVGFDGSRCPVARTLLTYSQSSDPSSAHYSDQTELYAAGRMVRERFCAKDIAAAPGLRVLHVRP